ncbi:MAG: PAS domain S-box protein [Calditrichaeota bacterium]|nr:PAS domain S-box protein [Calditrichota bacterium]
MKKNESQTVLGETSRIPSPGFKDSDLADTRSLRKLLNRLEKYRLMVENANEAIVIVQDGKLEFVNPKLLEMVDYSWEELVSKPFLDFVHPDDRDLVAINYRKRIQGEKFENVYSFRLVGKNGDIKWVEINAIRFMWEGAPATLNFLTDVSGRKKIEKEYEHIFELAQKGTWIFDHDFNTSVLSAILAEMLGYTTREMTGKNLREFLPRNDIQNIKPVLIALKRGDAVEHDFDLLHKSDSRIYVKMKLSPIADADGTFLGAHAKVINMTDKKKIEKALIRSEARFRSVVQSAVDAIISTDSDGRVIFWNQAAQKMFGYCSDEMIGESVTKLMPGEYIEKHKAGIERLQKGGESGILDRTVELKGLSKDGKKFSIDLSLASWETDEGTFYTAIVRDISKRKKLESQVQQAQKMQAIGTLAGGIAHDFNNIIGAIMGYAELAVDDTEEGSVLHENLENIVTASMRAKELVKQILTFSRLDKLEENPICVSSIVKETLKLLRASLPKTIDIATDIDADSSFVLADPVQIQQIMLNLCSNAAYAMRQKGGRLHVKVTAIELNEKSAARTGGLSSGQYVQIAVNDSGDGIDKAIIDRIFDPFFTTKRVGEGTGMGLSVIHGIIERLHGKITVDSKIGQGTTFRVFLPRLERKEIRKQEAKSMLVGGKESILYIDDEEDLVRIAVERFSELGYHITGKTNSVEAMDLFQKDPDAFDLIITDQTMPGLSGKELSERVLEMRPQMPIILCSGYSETITRQEAMKVGIREFVLKPISIFEMPKIVRHILDEKNKTMDDS